MNEINTPRICSLDVLQRGFHKKINRLLWQCFPKRMKIGDVSRNKIDDIQFLIYSRLREGLSCSNPIEFLSGKCVNYCANLGLAYQLKISFLYIPLSQTATLPPSADLNLQCLMNDFIT